MANLSIDLHVIFPDGFLEALGALAGKVPAPAQEEHPIEEVSPYAPPAAPAVGLEDVRAALAVRLKAGRKDEVHALFHKYGADKLSDVKPEDYASLLQDAEAM